jgi:Rhodanese-related sulfurtransferase
MRNLYSIRFILFATLLGIISYVLLRQTLPNDNIRNIVKDEDAIFIDSLSLADFLILQQDEKNVVLDLRDKESYEYAHIAGAFNLPSNELKQHGIDPGLFAQLRSAPNVIVYCLSSACGLSYHTAQDLIHRGIPSVKVYHGGWMEWKACKLPIEPIK